MQTYLIKNIVCELHFRFKRAQNDLKENHHDKLLENASL